MVRSRCWPEALCCHHLTTQDRVVWCPALVGINSVMELVNVDEQSWEVCNVFWHEMAENAKCAELGYQMAESGNCVRDGEPLMGQQTAGCENRCERWRVEEGGGESHHRQNDQRYQVEPIADTD